MIGTMDSATTLKPKIRFCYKNLQITKHNLEAEAIHHVRKFERAYGFVQITMHLCKIPPFLIKHDAKILLQA